MTPEIAPASVPIKQETLPGFADPRILGFVHAAIKDRAHLKKPDRLSPVRWARRLNIMGTYIYTKATGGDLGATYGVTRQAISLIVRDTLSTLWENSSVRTQKAYPLETLDWRRKWLLSLGSLSITVAEALQRGKAVAQIRKELDLSRGQLAAARRTLRWQGVELPHLIRTSTENRDLAERVEQAQSDKEIRGLIKMVTLGFLNRDRKRKQRLLVSVARLGRDAGFHFGLDKVTDLFVGSLKRAGVSVGELPQKRSDSQRGKRPLFFIAAQHRQRAIEVLRADTNLREYIENPVEQICGPKMDVPSTTILMKKGGDFGSLGRILIELGVSLRKLRDLLTKDCPVPILRYRQHSYYYPTDRKDELCTFLRRRLREMGITEAPQQ